MNAAADSPGIVRLQPLPTLTILGRHLGVTAITRQWVDGDELRCRLCPSCAADGGICQVQTTENVTEDNAPLYSLVGVVLGEAVRRSALP